MLRAERPRPQRRYRALAIPFALAALIVAVAALFAGHASAGQTALPDGNSARTIHEASPASTPCGSWAIVPSPNGTADHNYIFGMEALAATDIWAVGHYIVNQFPNPNVEQSLAMRWNGGEWQIFPSPNPSDRYNWLYDAAAISSTDVWAVGAWFNQGQTDMLGMHWDGAQWTLMSPSGLGQLNAVSAVASNDVWAVGTYLDAGVFRARIAHWTGSQWTTVPAPNTGPDPSFLFSITAIAANNVWAVGRTGNHPDYQSLILHYNGTLWSVVPHPSVEQLMSVDASSAGDVWAVGDGTLYYNGTSWSQVPISLPANSTLQSVTAVAPGEAWLAGYYVGGSGTETLTYHWDGAAWSQVPSFNADNFNVLTAIDAVSSQDVWAVGHSSPGGGAPYSTMTGRFTPGSACQTHTPTSTPTASSPTATRTLTGTPSPTSTATPSTYPCAVFPSTASSICESPDTFNYRFTFSVHHCNTQGTATITLWVSPNRNGPWTAHDSRTMPVQIFGGGLEIAGAFTETNVPQQNEWYYISASISYPGGSTSGETRPAPICDFDTCDNFTDVLPNDYFYEAVCYLYAYGAVSGYADGTFRPYNSTTRGQLTKIVVVAFNYPLYTPPTPTFTDVPTTHTFYQYIETAAYEGLVSGYADSTFRPQNEVTRGQLSKIVVEAAGWFLYNPLTPTFSDVPTTHPFYRYIETAYLQGIISGYADGTFRPGNNATRGQISKIVYNAVQGLNSE